jgi:predicted regulator of Ras-like GTPase activity (Roadblock/LC7/MglB family)
MEAAQALRELMEVSSQITAAVVLDAEGTTLASAPEGPASASRLTAATQELVAAAAAHGADGRDVTRVEVELGEGAFFVVREGGHTVGATTGPSPTSGLVVYDLRTCAQAISAEAPKKRRSARKPKAESEDAE